MNEALLSLLEQKHVMRVLIVLKDAPSGFNLLQKRSSVNTATLKSVLQLLETKGYVNRMPCPVDKRCVGYELSEKGQHLALRVFDLLERL